MSRLIIKRIRKVSIKKDQICLRLYSSSFNIVVDFHGVLRLLIHGTLHGIIWIIISERSAKHE